MATDEQGGTMPEPDIQTDLSIDEVCELIGTEPRREVIEQIAMRGWPSIGEFDSDTIHTLESRAVVRVRGTCVGRGENYEAALRALNAVAKELRDLR